MKEMRYRLKRQGFTLIELLLVIAVVAVLATFGLSTYRERALNLKAEKVAQQMQLILQAGSNYYVRNSCWPDNVTSITPPNTNHRCIDNLSGSEPFMPNYFPAGPMRHPTVPTNYRLYNPFWVGPTDNVDYAYKYHRAGTSPNENAIFQVESGFLPNRGFAQRVAALLPNAWIMANPPNATNVIVAAQISPPGAQNLPPFMLAGMGHMEGASNGSRSFSFDCPTNYLPVAMVSAQHFSIGTIGLIPLLATIKDFSVQIAPDGSGMGKNCTTEFNPPENPGWNRITCYPYIKIRGRGGTQATAPEDNALSGNGYLFYIAACCKIGIPGCRKYP
ncbi:MAG: type II secretion system protein [Gammaproteobacteria bacterium]